MFDQYVTSILTSNRNFSFLDVSGNLRLNPHVQLGSPYYNYTHNPDIADSKQLIIDELSRNTLHLSATLVIDKKVLDDEELMNAIRGKIERERTTIEIRIADEGYTLTREDFDKLSFVNYIAVDNCVEELEENQKIILQGGIYKHDAQAAFQPVIERRTSFNEIVGRQAYHINHPLNEEEFETIAQIINDNSMAAIELDYFDPSYYREFLEGLQRHHARSNVNIQMIGYLLQDQLSTYRELTNYPFEVDIVYSTCHDMIERHTREPYCENRLYYSQIEGGGKTSLQNYINVLNELSVFEQTVRDLNLSPLETAIYAKMRLDTEYIYDPDADNVDEWDNINLSQMINHEVNGQKRAVCMGFSTLFSAYLRRTGIPMFRYSTTGHSRNIGRIHDDKYGIDTICTSDVTFDLQSSNDHFATYSNFMIAPRENVKANGSPEHMTIADSLALPQGEYERLLPDTNLYYEMFYHPVGYNPLGYTARMLELMGYVPEDGIMIDIYENIYQLCEEGHLEGIPTETLLQAINNVLNIFQISPDVTDTYYRDAAYSINEMRPEIFSGTPTLVGDNPNVTYPVSLLTQENVRDYRNQLGDDRPVFFKNLPEEAQPSEEITPEDENHEEETHADEINEMFDSKEELIPGTNIHKPRDRGIYETDEEYETFLQQYYETHFPNNNYVNAVLQYAQNNHISLFDYYVEVARNHQNNQEANLPEFERNNPFIKETDLQYLTSTEDDRIHLYFANTMSKVIEKNISQNRRDELAELFTDGVERYNEEVGRIR